MLLNTLRFYGVEDGLERLILQAKADFDTYVARMGQIASLIAKKKGWPESSIAEVFAQLNAEAHLTGAELLAAFENTRHEIIDIITTKEIVDLVPEPIHIRLSTPAEGTAYPYSWLDTPLLLNNTGERPTFVLPVDAQGHILDQDVNIRAYYATLIAHEVIQRRTIHKRKNVRKESFSSVWNFFDGYCRSSIQGDSVSIIFIVNPASGFGKTLRRWKQVEQKLRKKKLAFDVMLTHKAGDGTLMTRSALNQGYQTVVAVGGDGTLNEVVNGFFHHNQPIEPKAVLGVLPSGSGCDFAKTLNISSRIDPLIAAIEKRRMRPIDVGHVRCKNLDGAPSERYFLNIASFGMSSQVIDDVNRVRHPFGASVGFLWSGIKAFLFSHGKNFHLSLDGQKRTVHALNVFVANGRCNAGGMYWASDAKIDDGLLDVVVLTDVSKYALPVLMFRIYGKQSLKAGGIQTYKVAEFSAHTPGEVLIETDGELIGKLPATFKVLPKAIQIVEGISAGSR